MSDPLPAVQRERPALETVPVADLLHGAAMQIEEATSIDELLAAALRVDAMVALMHRDGTRVERIARRVGELNGRLFARSWSLLAPAQLQADSCLVVMGSEGRGEQIVKTDQDNALLLRDGVDFDSLETVAAAFNAALSRFGYPPCPGDIMLTNALWRQPVGAFKATLRGWLFGADPEGVMNLAIFLDARAVAGDAGLLAQARRFVHDSVVDNDAFFARFARAAVQFEEGGGWWSRLSRESGGWWSRLFESQRHGSQRHGSHRHGQTTFDLKKLGTFPIVHGARALALQHRIDALDTAERLQALAQRGVLEETLCRDLIEALRFMMAMKLQVNLRQRESALVVDNRVRLSDLSTLEREALRASLAIIRSFRQYLQRHFRLDVL